MAVTTNQSELSESTTSNYAKGYHFENWLQGSELFSWMEKNWYLSIYCSALYIILVFGGRKFMESKPAYNLRWPLATWNIVLALFSIVGTLRILPGFYHIIFDKGFTFSVCNISYAHRLQPSAFWGWLFIFSKVLEFGDTAFIVLRKQKLIFLHWYHHIVTLIFTWYNSASNASLGHWFIFMNIFVHSLMYSYYALRAFKIKVPRKIAVTITLFQISQMFMGVFLCFWAYRCLFKGIPCEITFTVLSLNSFMYFTYVLLFCYFFYNSYIVPTKVKQSEKKDT